MCSKQGATDHPVYPFFSQKRIIREFRENNFDDQTSSLDLDDDTPGFRKIRETGKTWKDSITLIGKRGGGKRGASSDRSIKMNLLCSRYLACRSCRDFFPLLLYFSLAFAFHFFLLLFLFFPFLPPFLLLSLLFILFFLFLSGSFFFFFLFSAYLAAVPSFFPFFLFVASSCFFPFFSFLFFYFFPFLCKQS